MAKITSAATSINSTKVPALFRKVTWVAGMKNLDLGGGRYDTATEYLKGYGAKNYIYDPHNRTPEHNAKSGFGFGTYHSVTLSNVLNVVKSKKGQMGVLEMANLALRVDGVVYITVYQGDGSGVGKVTTKGYQQNKKLWDYLPMVKKVFTHAGIQNGMITAFKG